MKDPIALAKNYVTLSNQAVLEDIWSCFEPDADYQSSQFGTFKGLTEIQPMMRDFFQRFPNPHWEVSDYRLLDDDTVEFPFTMTGRNTGGETVERKGVERLQVNTTTGKIRAVHVAVL
jgi:hypothetical protein